MAVIFRPVERKVTAINIARKNCPSDNLDFFMFLLILFEIDKSVQKGGASSLRPTPNQAENFNFFEHNKI